MLSGSAAAKLPIDDFPNGIHDSKNLPTIELITVVTDENKPGPQWIWSDPHTKEMFVRERWTWSAPDTEPVRQGFSNETNDWANQSPWGLETVANARRPRPYRVDSFANPNEQANTVVNLLIGLLQDRVSSIKETSEDNQESDYTSLITKLASLENKIVEDAKDEIVKIEQGIGSALTTVFPGYAVKFVYDPPSPSSSTFKFFQSGAHIKMGPSEGYKSKVSQQGSGAQRTLLWSTIKYINEAGLKKTKKGESPNSERPHILLIDEPELCLHPNSIRQACKALYDLPSSGNWQVMVTTHSPIFIDLSRDHTSIVRVDKLPNGDVRGTTLYRPDEAKLTPDDKEELKLLNIFDPYVAEFFFGGRIIIVEGDTEYTALKYIAAKDERFSDVHIIRARGKATIASVAKILNQFASRYAILHDSDHPITKTKDGTTRRNSAWKANLSIKEVTSQAKGKVRLLASVPNFEEAFLDVTSARKDKPYMALADIKGNPEAEARVRDVLLALTDFNAPVPRWCCEWKSIEELEQRLGIATSTSA